MSHGPTAVGFAPGARGVWCLLVLESLFLPIGREEQQSSGVTAMHSMKGVHRKNEERKLIVQDFALFPCLCFILSLI